MCGAGMIFQGEVTIVVSHFAMVAITTEESHTYNNVFVINIPEERQMPSETLEID